MRIHSPGQSPGKVSEQAVPSPAAEHQAPSEAPLDSSAGPPRRAPSERDAGAPPLRRALSELLSSDVGPAASPSRPAMLLPADKAADTASRIAGNTVGKVTRGEVSLRERYDPTALLAAAIRASRGCVQLLL